MITKKPHGLQPLFDFNDIIIPSYLHWRVLLKKLYMGVFKWSGLPDTMDEIYMERMLLNNGLVFAYREPALNQLICLAANAGDKLNVYGYPSAYNVWGLNGFTDLVPAEAGFPLYDNTLHEPIVGAICYYASRLARIDETIDVNTDNQKTPYIIRGTQQQKLSLQLARKKILENERTLFLEENPKDRGVNPPLDVVVTPAPYVADNLQLQKQRLLTEVLNYMGVFSGVSTKAERMTTGENISQTGYIKSARDSRMATRQQFCKFFNKEFGTNISVEFANQDMEDLSIGLINGAGYGASTHDAREYEAARKETGDNGDN